MIIYDKMVQQFKMSKIILLFFHLMCYTVIKSDTPGSSIEEILNHLNVGNNITYDYHEDIILVLGNSGSGKSTLTQFIAGDNDNLISEEIGKDSGEFRIKDNGKRISEEETISKTAFPELVLDIKRKTAFYDCPGFSDTRGAAQDISATYFINKVTKHANRAKLVFTISYPSVRKGVNRHDFMLLVKHVISMIKNITKFEDSISLIVTKVDNIHVKTGNYLKLVPDQTVIENIADFLKGVKSELNTAVSFANTSNIQQFHEKAAKFIDILLSTDGQNYTKIGIFRRPDEPGPLSKITLLQNGKKYLEKIIYDNIKYVRYDSEKDFHYSISADSQLVVNSLTRRIQKNIQSNVNSIAQAIKDYYCQVVQNMLDKIDSFVNSATSIEIDVSEAQVFLTKFNRGHNIISKLEREISKITTPEELSNKLNNSITNLNIKTVNFTGNVKDIMTQGQYLHFLQKVSDQNSDKIDPPEWVFESVVYLDKLKENITSVAINVSDQIKSKIKSNIINSGAEIEKHFSTKEKTIDDIQTLNNEMRSGYEMLTALEITTENIEAEECIHQIINYIANLNGNINNRPLQNAKMYARYLKFLEIVSEQGLTHLFKCTEGLVSVIKYLNDSQKWYKFLIHLYERLSEYEIQKDTRACNNLANEIAVNYDNMKVENIGLHPFLKKCYPKYDYDNIKDITVGKLKLNSLKRILKLTLNYSLNISCENNKLVIKGQYVKLSDVKNSDCKQSKFIEVFSLDRVFIDTDLDKTGEEAQISIIAPIWHIQGIRKIILDGSPGKPHNPVKAQNGTSPGSHGEDGKPGLPGGSGGNFLGAGAEFINAKSLTITANGGKGGLGQHGGDGAKGLNGKTFPYYTTRWNDLDDVIKKGNWRFNKEEHFPLVTLFYNEFPRTYTILGKDGSSGGNGGNGGKGGYGGPSGNVFMLFNNAELNIHKHRGEMGLGGTAGTPGKGGKQGDTLIIQYECPWVLFIPLPHVRKAYYITSYVNAPGKEGIYGYNDLNMKKSEVIKYYNPSLTINDYKKYLREHLSGSARESSLKEFLNKLENRLNSVDK